MALQINCTNSRLICKYLQEHNEIQNEICIIYYVKGQKSRFIKSTSRKHLVELLNKYNQLHFVYHLGESDEEKIVIKELNDEEFSMFMEMIIQYKWIILRNEKNENKVKINFVSTEWYRDLLTNALNYYKNS